MKYHKLHKCYLHSLSITYKHPLIKLPHRKLHFSYIFQNNQLIAFATNNHIVPPVHFGYKERIEGNNPGTHSELAAWQKAKKRLKYNPFTIVNVRLNKSGEMRNSSPCRCCYQFLISIGCNEIYFTTNYGFSKLV